MRNLFDQYSHPENRLTHGLVSALGQDYKLLCSFVRWTTGEALPRGRPSIVEQRLPGEIELGEDEAERKGLPDAWIYNEDGWCLLIESKITASLTNDQLVRHEKTAKGRGFDEIHLVAVVVTKPVRALPQNVVLRFWSEIYEWLVKQSSRSIWAKHVREYMEITEGKLSEEGYLSQGTLTKFSGIQFREDEPYNYREAKRLINLAMAELRHDKRLVRELGMNPSSPGRGAITGKGGAAVWDFLRIDGRADGVFTKSPHLTLAIEFNRVLAIVTIPNSIKTSSRRNLIRLGYKGFQELLEEVNNDLMRRLGKVQGSTPWVLVAQRRYPSQRAAAIIDASLEFDLRTALPQAKGAGGKVKIQPQWLAATYEALSKKRSNLQLAVGASFPYLRCPATTRKEIIEHIASTWLACRPLLRVLLKVE